LNTTCPVCQKNHIIAGRRAWGCSGWREGCRFTLAYEVEGHPLSPPQAFQLITTKQLKLGNTQLHLTINAETGASEIHHETKEAQVSLFP
jgi:DNA topoisomerase-3